MIKFIIPFYIRAYAVPGDKLELQIILMVSYYLVNPAYNRDGAEKEPTGQVSRKKPG